MSDKKQVFKKRPTRGAQAATYTSFYSNNVALQITQWDFRFDFGQIKEATEKELVYESAIGVYMSPQHAKAFLQLLERNVQKYEELFGGIETKAVAPGVLFEQKDDEA